jgi:hypothetical protein
MHSLRFVAVLASFITTVALTSSARAQGAAQLPPPATPLPAPAPAAAAPLPAPAPAPSPAPLEPSAPAAGTPFPASSSMRLTYESTRVDRATAAEATPRSPDDSTILHGFRLGYGYVMNYDQKIPAFQNESLKEKVGLRTPSHFLIGYEVVYRVVGHSWLNILLMGNAMVAGLEQSKFLPSANLLIGFELKNAFQVGVGANLSPLAGSEGHAIIAAGWTPRVGTIYTPLHVFFVPDVDGVHRMGITTGVTF